MHRSDHKIYHGYKPLVPGSILILDADRNMHDHYDAILHHLGFSLLGPVQQCAAARKLLRTHRPQAAILNMECDKAEIWSLADHLQARGIYFLLTSAHPRSTADIPHRHRDALYLTKPLTREQLSMGLRLICDTLD